MPTIIVSHIPLRIRRSRRRHALILAVRIAALLCLTLLALQLGSLVLLGH
ncbi:MAG TPA: hypothetical protein VKY24_00775 [Reyranella sp.]|nr:hypothetical protein [Reyranella sp.]